MSVTRPRLLNRMASRSVWLVLSLVCGVAGMARADGEYFQVDLAPSANSAVATVQRGAFGVSLGWSEWDTGEATSLFASYSLPLPALGQGTTLKFGPSYRYEPGSREDAGLRLVVENYRQTDWGSLFLLGDYNSIKREHMLLAEAGLRDSGLSVSVSLQGDGEGFSEQSLVFGYGIQNTPLRLRLGHRFEADKTFVGLSINTF